MGELNSAEKQELYAWIDEVPLSRQKKNISRDFSDGVMAAELAHHFFPHHVDLHNYPPANSTAQKLNNWKTLNRKVFFKLDFEVPDSVLHDVVASKPGVIEYILNHFKKKVEQKNSQHLVCTDVFNVTQDNTRQHSTISPTHNFSSHLPPVIPNNDGNTSKHLKPSQIPRLTHSGGGSLPLINKAFTSQVKIGTSYKKDSVKLPAIKEGVSRRKYYSNPHYITTSQTSSQLQAIHVDTGIAMAEKDQVIMELQETIQLLTMKVNRLEHLIRVKDYKIQELEKMRR